MNDLTVPSARPILAGGPAIPRAAFWAFVVVAIVNVAANVAGEWWPGGAVTQVANVSQYFLMPLLAVTLWAIVPAPRGRLVHWVMLALAFSWLGDCVPDAVPSVAFLAMMGCFLAAQVAYIVGFWPVRRRSLAASPVAAAYGLVFLAIIVACAPKAGALLGPMVVYGACLTAMALLATGLGTIAGVGGGLFLVSDALIALREFGVVDVPASGFWVMSTYILAQALLTEAVARASVDPRADDAPAGRGGPAAGRTRSRRIS